ncbi:hypothetical protein CERSUDRAFT_120173 [Gelatoporia subvermispora B]|uniref:F-box domain-containing protein n=1 Tax=Ceriporiopsis subvermispora (strain B) TaxID=914234 RepID=M2P6V5_CERS8|nr:hypothetical protein CERSUDRAFT_120173 [Gelatoporia subvermispora B]
MTQTLHLPPEITDRVIDFLHYDISTLRRCALVCRAWLPASRFHLFQCAYVTSRDGWGHPDSPFLHFCPHLAPFVREVVLSTPSWRDGGVDHVLSVLQELHTVKRLVLLDWNIVSFVPKDTSAFAHITELTTSDFAVGSLAGFIAHFPRLEVLKLYDSHSSRLGPVRDASDISTILSRIPLRRLDIARWHEPIMQAVSRASLPKLTCLFWITTSPEDPSPQLILSALSHSLQEVTLDLTLWCRKEPNPEDYFDLFKWCPSGLRMLRIRGTPRILTAVATVLGPIVQTTFPQTEVEFVCCRNSWGTSGDVVAPLEALCRQLQTTWPRTTIVDLGFTGDMLPADERAVWVKSLMTSIFTKLVKRGTLRLYFVHGLREAQDRDMLPPLSRLYM